MPKVKLLRSRMEVPPIDWLLAAVLERKTVLGYDLKRMADVAGVTYETMRHYIRQSPWSWKSDARRRICDEFGLKPQVSVAMSDDPGVKIEDGRLSR